MTLWNPRALILLALLLSPALASAQTIHGYPGKAAYASSAEWPLIDAQQHCVPCDGSPAVQPPNTLVADLAHLHVGVKAPYLGEVSGPIDITVPLKLFHAAGGIYNVGAVLHGALNDLEIPVTVDTWPLIGDPNGLVSATGHFTLNVADGLAVGVPAHGWFTLRVNARAYLDNGIELSGEVDVPLYSMVDPTAPETNIGFYTQSKGTMKNPADTDQVPWGLNEMELRQMAPLLTPFNNPQIVEAFGFDYTPAPFPPGELQVLLDADFHMGIPGTVLPTTFDAIGGSYNTFNPAAMSLSPTPMGLLKNQHRITYSWNMKSGAGFDDPAGHVSAGQELRSLLSVIVTVGDAPDDSLPATVWTVDAAAPPPPSGPPPPPPPPPPAPPWVSFLPIFCRNTTTGQLAMFALASCAAVP